jgi:hypothetical protein
LFAEALIILACYGTRFGLLRHSKQKSQEKM